MFREKKRGRNAPEIGTPGSNSGCQGPDQESKTFSSTFTGTSKKFAKKLAGKLTGSWTVDQPYGRNWNLSLIWGSVIIDDV